jgi:phospholipid transport system substrate-binding protein
VIEHSLSCKNSRTYDVVIDGVSMVSNYKAQFNQMIRDDSYACLMEKMKQRNLQSV